VWLAASGHPLPALIEALLAAPGAFDHGSALASVAAGELAADLRSPPRMPGGFDQQPAHVAVADLRDRALPAPLAGRVLGRNQTIEGHELPRAAEATEVADLGGQRKRRQGVDPAQTAQPSNQLPPRLLLGRLSDRPLELLDPAVDEIDGVQVGVEGDLLGSMLEALLAEPLPTHDRPVLVGSSRPWRRQNFDRRCRSRIRSSRGVLARADQITRSLQLR
jgi:hypothetical protein